MKTIKTAKYIKKSQIEGIIGWILKGLKPSKDQWLMLLDLVEGIKTNPMNQHPSLLEAVLKLTDVDASQHPDPVAQAVFNGVQQINTQMSAGAI
jgi:hypothetical protein